MFGMMLDGVRMLVLLTLALDLPARHAGVSRAALAQGVGSVRGVVNAKCVEKFRKARIFRLAASFPHVE